MLDKINRRQFLVQTFRDGYPGIHAVLYKEFLKVTPAAMRNAYLGAEDEAYIKFLQSKAIPEFTNLVQQQVQGISRGYQM